MTLFSPFQLKHLTLGNRIVMPGMDANFGDEEGNITEETYRYYERRVRWFVQSEGIWMPVSIGL